MLKSNTKRVTLHCPTCGSDDIVRDATARWDADTQSWELSDTQDAMSCEACENGEFYEASEKPYTAAQVQP